MLKSWHKRFLEILQGAELTSKDVPHGYALSNIRQRILQIGSTEWLNYFVHNVKEYFQGCVQEAAYRAQEIVPDIDTYIIA